MTFLLSDAEVSGAYVDLRARVVVLLRSAPPGSDEVTVPHCPTWTVAELASHMLGVPDDILNGRMEGVASDAWTQAQVERHRGKSLAQIADELEALAPRFDSMLAHIPAMARSQMTMDAVTHEHDLRHAIGKPGARDSRAVRAGCAWLKEWMDKRSIDGAERFFDSGVSDFDLLRCLTGRRNLAQIFALGLDGAAVSRALAGSPLRIPTATIEE
jgi:uncharacterized protein (TIGR03083 family)